MDAFLCARLARALGARWVGAHLQQAWQDTRGRLILKFRRPGASALLLLSAEPDLSGVGFIPKRPPSPPRPPALAAYLRAHLVGGRLAAADNTAFEREITLTFKVADNAFALKLDMTGNKPALMVLGSDGRVKVATGQLRGGQKPGALHRPPPRPPGFFTPDQVGTAQLEHLLGEGGKLKSALIGVPGYLLENLEGRGVEVAQRGLRVLAIVREEAFALSIEGGRLLCHFDREQDDDAVLSVAGQWLNGPVGDGAEENSSPVTPPEKIREKAQARWRKKLQRRIKNIRADLARHPDVAELERTADTLAANLAQVRKGMDFVEVADLHHGGQLVRIPLDPSKSPGGNLDLLYKKVKKVNRAKAVAAARLAQAQDELEAGPPEQPGGVNQQKARAGQGGGTPSRPHKRFRSSDGWTILAGRNSVENDRLVREAKGWDLWLHARDGAGAHVIIKKPGKDSKVPQRTLFEAAGLAALNSKRAEETAVEVMYVEAERVKKPKGASPGRVLVSGEKTLRVKPGAGSPQEM